MKGIEVKNLLQAFLIGDLHFLHEELRGKYVNYLNTLNTIDIVSYLLNCWIFVIFFIFF